MSISTKALIAALALSLTPAIASAQINGYWGGGPGEPITIPDAILQPVAPGSSAGGALVEAQDCGASQLQWLLGQPLSVAQDLGIVARYFSPERMVGTMDYLPFRLNIGANENHIIDGVYCG